MTESYEEAVVRRFMNRNRRAAILILATVAVVAVPAVAQALAPVAVALLPEGDPSTWPTTDFRWWDVASNVYAAEYSGSYTYADAAVVLTYQAGPGATFAGHVSATNLKPNFAYQVKLVGKPTGIWGEDGDDLANENIGYLGRWWRAQPSPGNSSDADYEAHKDDPAYVYEGYLLFDWFVTDRFGGAEVDLALDSSFHVLATDAQGAPGPCDGPFIWSSIAGAAADPAYAVDVGPVDVGVYAQQESLRPCAGEAALAPGDYACRFVLTEESFHQTGAGSGTWAGAMKRDDLAFTITTEPTVDAHDYVDVGNLASEAGHALVGWGPVEPDTHGGGWGGIGGETPPGRCRTAWSPSEAAPVENWASLELDFGVSATAPKCLRYRWLDGGSDDSHAVAIDGVTVLTVPGPPTSETWRWASVDVTGTTGPHTVRFTATAAAGTYFDPYGQLAVDRIHVGTQINAVPANESIDRVDVLSCSGSRRVDFHYSRDCNDDPIRGYSVRVVCPEGQDRLSFDAGDVTVHVVPAGLASGDVFWQVHRDPDAAAANDWTIDYAILGEAAAAVGGIPADCDLFSIDFHGGPLDGDADVIVAEATVGLIDGGTHPPVGRGDAVIAVDCTPPAAVAGLAAAPGRDKVGLSWSAVDEPDGELEVWRGMWYLGPPDTSVSAYPEYDDHVDPADAEPSWPVPHAALAGGGEWHLIGTLPTTQVAFVDFPNPPLGLRRGVYHYLVYAVDAAGNVGAPPTAPARATSYLLGDLPSLDGTIPTDGAVAINPEINRLALCFGTDFGGPDFDPYCDVGPTHDTTDRGVPLTDDSIDFEDLMVFAMNYGVTLMRTPTVGGDLVRLVWAPAGPGLWALHLLDPCADLRGLRLSAGLPPGAAASPVTGELLDAQGGPCFLRNIPDRGLDVALARLDGGIVGAGELFRLGVDRALDPAALAVEARNSRNEPLETVMVEATDVPDAPVAFALSANHPNPFNPATAIDFALPGPQRVSLAVYAVDGRRVATLVDGPRPGGRHRVVWNGCDDRGEPAASGVYFARITAGSFVGTCKMTLLK